MSWQTDWKDFLESGGIMIADRYTTSNAIYECSKLLREQRNGYLDWLFDYKYQLLGIPEPNLVIYLLVDVEVSQKPLDKLHYGDESNKDIHEADVAYLKRLQEVSGYCAKKPGLQIISCCSEGAMSSVEDIQEEIVAVSQEVI